MTPLNDNKIHVILVAAGIGSRFVANGTVADINIKDKPKQYHKIGNQTVLAHSINAFSFLQATNLTVVLNPDDQEWEQQASIDYDHQIQTAVGGAQRHDSVRNGIKSLAADPQDWIIVHDAARPCVSQSEIQNLIDSCLTQNKGGLLVKPLSDTIKHSEDGETVNTTLDRNHLYAALTPQMFRCGDLLKALTVFEAGSITDESSALEAQGHHPIMVSGKNSNIKITSYEDLALAEAILKQQGRLE